MLKNAFPVVLFLCMTSFVQAAMMAQPQAPVRKPYEYVFLPNAFKHTKDSNIEAMKKSVNGEATMWLLPNENKRAKKCYSQCDENFKGGWDKYVGQYFRKITIPEHKLMKDYVNIGESFVCISKEGVINHIGPFRTQADADRKTCFICLMNAQNSDKYKYKVKPNKNSNPGVKPMFQADIQVRVTSRTDSFVGRDWLLMAAFGFTFGLTVLFYCQRRKEEADLYSLLADLEEVE